MVIEASQDPSFMPRLMPLLAYRSAGRGAGGAVRRAAGPSRCWNAISSSIETMRQRAECRDGAVFYDISDHELEGYNKFIPYYLLPGVHLQRGLEQEQLPHQGFGGIQSLGAAPTTW